MTTSGSEQGFSISGDSDGRWPLVMASPHSGRDYPSAFLAMARLPLAQLRRAEDGYVDGLLDGIAGVPVLRALKARAWLDLNRAPDELDAAMFDGPLPMPVVRSDRVAAGLGILPRVAAHGMDIYSRQIPAAEAARRIAALHTPWHASLDRLLGLARAHHGHAILIDCHSMPSPGGPRPPQVVIGDRHGCSADPDLVTAIEAHFSGLGWRTRRNTPYAGGYTTERHGQPAKGIHAVQIEIDRALYMDSQKLLPHAGFAAVASAMTGLARMLVTFAPMTAVQRDAAE
ncbi:N-formylglutamate amidohydrolase [Sandarakinorhabdus sp.]|uniref:N-formylglutamate amidohydrolase n=1 Tax=Sandarakinorhabdus sp. TaxID=1916663 RepID=UPI00286DCAB3|nr:N-formylglutamate amidohydrolase [Sandarakinorhabdus sp.]